MGVQRSKGPALQVPSSWLKAAFRGAFCQTLSIERVVCGGMETRPVLHCEEGLPTRREVEKWLMGSSSVNEWDLWLLSVHVLPL